MTYKGYQPIYCRRGHSNWRYLPQRGHRLCVDCETISNRKPGNIARIKAHRERNREKYRLMRRARYLKEIERNAARARLRWLRLKEEKGTISDGEMEQMLEIATKYPSRTMAVAA